MANKTCGHLGKCGCETYLTTPPPCPTPENCPERQPCSEIFDAQCIVYTGPDLECGQDVIIAQNTSVALALEDLVSAVCDASELPTIPTNILCGDDVVVASGVNVVAAIQDVVEYFCNLLPPPVGYLEFRATLSQVGGADVDPTILGTATLMPSSINRVSAGVYHFNAVGAFPNPAKVEVDIENALVLGYSMTNAAFNIYSAAVLNANVIEIRTAQWSYNPIDSSTSSALSILGSSTVNDSLADSLLNNTRFVVRVWS